ncbi:putative alpha-actinin; sarcomeric [Paratrimastix pyriformis]|uniref:Alpha-actinin n=1 Tax=Paratrimastix pyriformis TaxID=342808 RepID=A0ABQ8UD76_9EUKA|nr:putative alpha-actinin; sarcomeric [Paratrimastix pyriformis]
MSIDIQHTNKCFLRWINSVIKERGIEIQSLPDNLSDGIILGHLLEILEDQKDSIVPSLGTSSHRRFTRMANMDVVLEHIKSLGIEINVDSESWVGSEDDAAPSLSSAVADQLLGSILDVVWAIFEGLVLNKITEGDRRGKDALLSWVNSVAALYPPHTPATSWLDDFRDGFLWAYLMHSYNPRLIQLHAFLGPRIFFFLFHPSFGRPICVQDDPISNLHCVMQAAEEGLGVTAILDPDVVAGSPALDMRCILMYTGLLYQATARYETSSIQTRQVGAIIKQFTRNDALRDQYRTAAGTLVSFMESFGAIFRELGFAPTEKSIASIEERFHGYGATEKPAALEMEAQWRGLATELALALRSENKPEFVPPPSQRIPEVGGPASPSPSGLLGRCAISRAVHVERSMRDLFDGEHRYRRQIERSRGTLDAFEEHAAYLNRPSQGSRTPQRVPISRLRDAVEEWVESVFPGLENETVGCTMEEIQQEDLRYQQVLIEQGQMAARHQEIHLIADQIARANMQSVVKGELPMEKQIAQLDANFEELMAASENHRAAIDRALDAEVMVEDKRIKHAILSEELSAWLTAFQSQLNTTQYNPAAPPPRRPAAPPPRRPAAPPPRRTAAPPHRRTAAPPPRRPAAPPHRRTAAPPHSPENALRVVRDFQAQFQAQQKRLNEMQSLERELNAATDQQRIQSEKEGIRFILNPYAAVNYDVLYDMFRQFREFAAREESQYRGRAQSFREREKMRLEYLQARHAPPAPPCLRTLTPASSAI